MKKILSLLLVVVMVFSMSSVAFAADFNDSVNIPQSDAIDVIETLGIVEGYEDGHFRPHTVLTRAELCTMLTRALYGDPIYVKENVFKDVPNHWAKPYIYTAYANGMMEGYGNGYFGPEDEITYTQMAAVIMKALGYDCAKLGWADGVVSMAHTLGIFDGIDFNSYAEGCTRADAAQMIFNAFDLEYVNHKGDFPKEISKTFLFDGFGFVKIKNGEKVDGHIYEAYKSTTDKTAKPVVTDNRLTTTKVIYAVDATHYKMDKEATTSEAINWNEVELYINGVKSDKVEAIAEKNALTASFLEDKLIAIFVEAGAEYYYAPTGEGFAAIPQTILDKATADKNFDPTTSVVKYFRETGKFEILNSYDYGWVTAAHTSHVYIDGVKVSYENDGIAKGDYVRVVYDFEGDAVIIENYGRDPYVIDKTNKIAHTFECLEVEENVDCEMVVIDDLAFGTHKFKNCDKCNANLDENFTIYMSVDGWEYYHDGNCDYIIKTEKPRVKINPLTTTLKKHECIH